MVFIDVIVPVPLPGLFTYFAEEEIVHQLGVGKRVVVKFGRGKLYTAIIHTIHNNPPKNCLLYTSPSPRDMRRSRMPSSA